MDIYNWLIANKLVIGGVAIAALLGGEKAIAFIKDYFAKNKTGLPVPTTDQTPIKVEVMDQDAIRHLRIRAAQLKNTKLIAVIKEADSIFYDIHTGVSNAS